MRLHLVLLPGLVALLSACASGHGASRSPSTMPTHDTEEVRALLALEHAVVRAIQSRDTHALQALVAEDFVFRGPDGTELGRADFLAGIAAIPGTLLSVETESLRAHVFGDTGVLTGIQRARVRLDDGTEAADAATFTDVCQRREGRWWLILAHSLPTPPGAPTAP
ncbi:nuclear transport factor 2 family protein [Myxococcus sp. K15C18031901]|uniref:nuclear transport factor 2 family protein n=1 Tax=Myxococcus dinghuensis TaxID=2906761 RepID=UPI0020A7B534|nr:DUF4440 domain-containing protein [Myxococcus dinghuensis]MCP3098319.1 nuclear transport factor 2 family protein [Myxococcus dinghuensis]